MSTPLQVPGLAPGTWTIDPVHTTVGFTVRHLMVSKVRGTFQKFSGEITVGENALLSSVRAEIDMTSIDTAHEARDNDLRSRNFLETDRFPTMTFASTGVKGEGAEFTVAGDLTIKGVTHSVELALEFNGVVTDPNVGTRAGFSAITEINRKDYGITFDMPLEGGGVVVGDKINIELEVEAVHQA